MLRTLIPPCVAAIVLVSARPAAADPHGGDIWLAASSAGQLKLSPGGFLPTDAVVVLGPGGPWYPGWSDDAPGFDDIATPDPANDCYPFASGAAIELEVLALDPALVVWHGFTRIDPGQTQILGTTPGDIHLHLNWHIHINEPSYDPLRVHWRGTFILRDYGATGYADSEPFTLVFSNVNCTTGDLNFDGFVNAGDIDPFVYVLLNSDAVSAEERCAADANLDGLVNAGDIDAFVALIVAD